MYGIVIVPYIAVPFKLFQHSWMSYLFSHTFCILHVGRIPPPESRIPFKLGRDGAISKHVLVLNEFILFKT